jgi:GntR family transcriptional regulator
MNSIPLYSRIESLLRSKILSGQYKPKEKLPIKEELARQFSVSKITISKALFHLQMEGLITSNRGKGTFVSEVIPVIKQFIITSSIPSIVVDAARYEVKAIDIQTIKVKETRFAKDIQTVFKLSAEDEIQKIRRIRLLKGIPIWYLENFIPLAFAQRLDLNEEELSQTPLLEIIKSKTDLIISRGEMYLEAVPAEPDIAEILHCQTFEPLFYAQVYYWLSTGEAIECSKAYLRGEYFKYKVDLNPGGL